MTLVQGAASTKGDRIAVRANADISAALGKEINIGLAIPLLKAQKSDASSTDQSLAESHCLM